MAKSCDDCGFYKLYVNRKKMEELKTEKVIWLELCENINMPATIEDTSIADTCKHYDDDSWMK
jgi:hypothetical protein